MVQTSNLVFLGCNYNDKKIKAQFDALKKRIETDTPLQCVIIDKQKGKPAADIWKKIKQYIESSAICIFDVTAFRPNVVLELGYALSIKSEEQIFITFRKRKSKGKAPLWLLSDIGHLTRHEYVRIAELESYIREQLALTPYLKSYSAFIKGCGYTAVPEKYAQAGLTILQTIRDKGTQSEQQLKSLISGSSCRIEKLISLMKKNSLIKRPKGKNGKFFIPELMA